MFIVTCLFCFAMFVFCLCLCVWIYLCVCVCVRVCMHIPYVCIDLVQDIHTCIVRMYTVLAASVPERPSRPVYYIHSPDMDLTCSTLHPTLPATLQHYSNSQLLPATLQDSSCTELPISAQ